GIRDFHVTGVQTCALPIWPSTKHRPYTTARLVRDCILISSSGTHRCTVKNEFKNDENQTTGGAWAGGSSRFAEREINAPTATGRSEERRVGKERRCRGSRE